MALEYPEIKEQLEADGFSLTDEEYAKAVSYSRRKAEVAGENESYVPYLLPDVIREWSMRQAINYFTLSVKNQRNIK